MTDLIEELLVASDTERLIQEILEDTTDKYMNAFLRDIGGLDDVLAIPYILNSEQMCIDDDYYELSDLERNDNNQVNLIDITDLEEDEEEVVNEIDNEFVNSQDNTKKEENKPKQQLILKFGSGKIVMVKNNSLNTYQRADVPILIDDLPKPRVHRPYIPKPNPNGKRKFLKEYRSQKKLQKKEKPKTPQKKSVNTLKTQILKKTLLQDAILKEREAALQKSKKNRNKKSITQDPYFAKLLALHGKEEYISSEEEPQELQYTRPTSPTHSGPPKKIDYSQFFVDKKKAPAPICFDDKEEEEDEEQDNNNDDVKIIE